MSSDTKRMDRRIILSIMALTIAVLFGGLLPSSKAEESERVLLRLKAEPNETYRYNNISNGQYITQWSESERDVMENEMRVSVEAQVESVKQSGRMDIRQHVNRMVLRKIFNGKVLQQFDSSKPNDMEMAQKDPNFAHLLTFLKSSWKIRQNATGEIIDYEITIPDKETAPAAFELVFKNMVESLIEEEKVLFPEQAVAVGESWDGGTKIAFFSGLGQVERSIKYTLLEISMSGDERIAVIKLEIINMFSPDIDSGVEKKLTEFKEDGTLLLALGRGRIKSLRSTRKVTIDYYDEADPHTTYFTAERVIEEVTP